LAVTSDIYNEERAELLHSSEMSFLSLSPEESKYWIQGADHVFDSHRILYSSSRVDPTGGP